MRNKNCNPQLVLDRSCLCAHYESLPTSMIKLEYFKACFQKEIETADEVLFMESCRGDQGPIKVLKDKYNECEE